ncbi:transmembrane protein 138 [Strongylocentrotus purpuratus]|uniref:Transmembrane protein 138 n=1 Tax=Strongylocentrotus purpuratus TaxID=7668 RepID=A0A7M7G9L1_STRPU|nr:transmembrane protein 138 [Strongylocentrotus purpuratus]|eukprot:XP_001185328.2 PREDICTED: transmembrane protein 138 [Strongylocentrotus purpuratus]
MQVSQYRGVLYLQYFLLFVDLFINAFCDLLRIDNVTQLVLFIIQDISQIFATIVIFLMFFNTYVFQAGLVGYLVSKFKFTIVILFLYFMLCVGLHVWTMTLRWNNVDAYIWNNGYQALYVFQRVGAVFYYYYYKRTALRLGDPRFYRDSRWLREQFDKVR